MAKRMPPQLARRTGTREKDPVPQKGLTRNERVYAAVRRIPRGKVATYGQIARLSGLGPLARQVGYALHALTDDSVPWHRVVNARGLITQRAHPELQRALLESEGIAFDPSGRIDLPRFQWRTGR